MADKIYYLTGTGNSLKIAKDIRSRLQDFELISMPHLMKNSHRIVIEGDRVGFVFPVYFGKPPVFVQEFIDGAEFRDTSYIFAVANGGGLFGRTLKHFEKGLGKKEKHLDAGFLIGMPATHPHITLIHKKPHKEYFEQEEAEAETITDIVSRRDSHTPKNPLGLLEAVYAAVAFDIPYDLSKSHKMDRHFWIGDGCSNCGLCIDVCPVGNIIQTKWKPAWQNDCINCLACYHSCPWKGIQLRSEWKFFDTVPYDLLSYRYRHPDITLEEIMHQEETS